MTDDQNDDAGEAAAKNAFMVDLDTLLHSLVKLIPKNKRAMKNNEITQFKDKYQTLFAKTPMSDSVPDVPIICPDDQMDMDVDEIPLDEGNILDKSVKRAQKFATLLKEAFVPGPVEVDFSGLAVTMPKTLKEIAPLINQHQMAIATFETKCSCMGNPSG